MNQSVNIQKKEQVIKEINMKIKELIKRLKERFQDSQDNGVDFSLKELKELKDSQILKRQEFRDRLLKMNEKQILVEIAMMLYKEK